MVLEIFQKLSNRGVPCYRRFGKKLLERKILDEEGDVQPGLRPAGRAALFSCRADTEESSEGWESELSMVTFS